MQKDLQQRLGYTHHNLPTLYAALKTVVGNNSRT